MSTRYNTGNPIESTDVRDMSDNAKNFDEFSNSNADIFTDRIGNSRKTLGGAIRAITVPIIGDFTTGCTVTSSEQGVQEIGGSVYRWKGSLPKSVPPSSTPVDTGGISPSGDWVNIGDASARGDIENLKASLSSSSGSSLIGEALYGDIRGYSGVGSHIKCSGKASGGDGAGGIFYLDVSDTTTPDDGVIVLVDAIGRRWKRDHTPGEINLLWATGRIIAGVDYTAEFEAAAKATSVTTNGNAADMRCGKLKMPGADVLLRNAYVRNPGLVLDFPSNGIGRIVGDTAGVTLTVHPLRGDSVPYTNTGYGGLFINNGQIAAISEEARNSGTGLLMINCFNTQFINQYVAGFKYCIMLRGSHFAQFRNFYAADEKNSVDNPNEEIFNRGYAIIIDPTPAAGETESTGLVISGGWIHNSAIDLSFGSNYTIEYADFEPASNTFNLGSKGHVHDCRMERMDYYAVNAVPPKYAPFPWFHVIGDGNLIEHNEIHSLGATNDPAITPKFKVTGNGNKFIFDKDGIRFGLIKLWPATSGNHVEIGKFKDLQYFAAGAESQFYVENVHIYEGYNTHKLVEDRSYVESFFDFYEVQNCASVQMTAPANVQGLTKVGETYTVDGSSSHRIICNFNTPTKYTPGMYCLKFRLKCYSNNMKLNIAASYLKASAHSLPMQDMNGGYCFVRFQIVGTDDLIMPTFNIQGAVAGDSFTLSNVELLKFNGGRYAEADYVIA